jgi:hypothetical protein
MDRERMEEVSVCKRYAYVLYVDVMHMVWDSNMVMFYGHSFFSLSLSQSFQEGRPPLGPGGLDPLEVLEELPVKMREAFENQDIAQLHKVQLSQWLGRRRLL